jgi:hypothetical protein
VAQQTGIPDLTLPGAALELSPEYRSHYNALVRPHLRFTVSRYFAERWVATLGLYRFGAARGPLGSAGKTAGRAGWLVTECRQVVFWGDHSANRGEHAFSRSLDYIARECGLSREMTIAVLAEPWLRWFVKCRSGRPVYGPERGRAVQPMNSYSVRMDDPLVPADAERLAEVLATAPVQGSDCLERALQRLTFALEQPRASLLAADPRRPLEHPDWFAGERPPEVLDLLELAEPGLAAARLQVDPQDERWVELASTCETLADYVVAPRDVVGEYYYFRRHWVKRLGRGQAWAVLLLRDRCFDRPGQGLRDRCWLPDYDWLAQRIGVDAKSIGDWLNAGLGGFVRVLEQRKGWDRDDPQRVGYSLWLALRDPLTPEDQGEYERRLSAELASRWPTPGQGESGESGLSGQGSEENPDARRDRSGEQTDTGAPGCGENADTRGPGWGEHPDTCTDGSAEQADWQSPGSGENDDSRKPDTLIAQSSSDRSGDQQTAPISQTSGSQPAAVDRAKLVSLLLRLGVNNPARDRILAATPAYEDVLGWALYAQGQPGLKSLPGFLISRLLDGEPSAIPEPFGRLAQLAPEQWTDFALAARRRLLGDAAPWGLAEPRGVADGDEQIRVFEAWAAVYGELDFAELPFGLGKAAGRLWQARSGENGDGQGLSQAHGRARGQTRLGADGRRPGRWRSDYDLL